jgi:parallel beta-helix repeat protein
LRILDNTIQAMYDNGIVLRGVWDLTVDGNYIYSDKNGIFATSAHRLSIHHNQVESYEHGVRIETGDDLDISDNRLIAYGGSAVGLSKASNFNVRNNLCVSEKRRTVGKLGSDGIYLENSQDGTIDGNKYAGEDTCLFWEGIRIVNSARIKALNNDIRARWIGIGIYSCKSEDVPCVLSQNKCTITGVEGSYPANGSRGITVSDSVRVEIIKNECNECSKGIEISESQKITAADNVCVQNDMVGIYLKSSNHCVLENNECALNGSAVLFSDTPRSAESSCTGISALFSGNITIRKNKCYDNADHGILLYSCKQCMIEGNSCSRNGMSGIALASTNDSKLIKNYCRDNGLVGIHLSSSCNGAVVRSNVCTGHGKFGIEALGFNISILYNKCTDNQYRGIRVAEDPERRGITLYKNKEE